MAALKDIYWMSSPLAIDQRNTFTKEIDAMQGKRATFAKPVKKYIDPKNEIHVFRKIEHWTLEVDGCCYELTPDLKKKLPFIKKVYDMIKPATKDATAWHELRKKQQIEPERRKVGRTAKTPDEIVEEVNYIWDNFNKEKYLFFTQNCQNFAHMLYERIGVPVADAERHLWEKIPDPVGYRIAEGAQLTLAGQAIGHAQAVLGSGAAIGGTGTATASTGTVGAMSGTGGTAVAGGTATGSTTAVGSTGTMGAMAVGTTAGGTAATGSGAGAAGGTAVGGTGATVTGGTAAGGTTVGGTTAGSGAAGHMSFGAKAAGLLHGSGHGAALSTKAAAMAPKAAALMHGGHAAAIGGGAAKVGVVAAGAHAAPVILTGGLVYLAWRGKKSKRFNKKNKKEEDLDVLDMLEVEDQYNEAADNPELAAELENDIEEGMNEELKERMDDADQEGDNELGEKMASGLLLTEIGGTMDQTSSTPEPTC